MEVSLPYELLVALQRLLVHDTDYDVRYGLVLKAMFLANLMGFPTGYRIDSKEPEWPVAFITLPTGQVSWHMPQYPHEWDGHDNKDKQIRIEKYMQEAGKVRT